MVLQNKYTKTLINRFTSFKISRHLSDEVDLFKRKNEEINTHAVFSALTNYIIEECYQKSSYVLEEEILMYKFLDNHRTKYYKYPDNSEEGEFDNAICTCFLENLLNRSSWGSFDIRRVIPYLGEKSLEFCKDWDKFTGVRSPGLWNDKEWNEFIKNSKI